ncbi:helix-turn-helix transcriptional regulator [Anaerovorax odorimutans]|uniref:Helix-turn-helix transcriptional regulator n=1 Tax=Anaerovorax odorimutans TaxID=109327 RepID=A0ABT1RLN5_9FIRM|nr:helix-turn-helix transcriptional regulator [Anaerovorax odorimutans]MCQ4636097.1 helix-turn-helix transcriptional regulator [Anaerovorax odorimutans]
MVQKSIKGGLELAGAIKRRRNELNLTIEEAALKAGIGTKTWSRYEAGESIRKDKYKGVCKALNWPSFPEKESVDGRNVIDFGDYVNHEAWSPFLAAEFGKYAAVSFVIGSDILLDHIEEDMAALSSMPRGTHIGEISVSWLESLLPVQFLMRYDYDFLYVLRTTVGRFRSQASQDNPMVAHSAIEELALYLIVEESRFLMESMGSDMEECDGWDDWIYDIFDDMDLITFLYSDMYLVQGDTYHFDRWMEGQFYC